MVRLKDRIVLGCFVVDLVFNMAQLTLFYMSKYLIYLYPLARKFTNMIILVAPVNLDSLFLILAILFTLDKVL